jgi:putative transposase
VGRPAGRKRVIDLGDCLRQFRFLVRDRDDKYTPVFDAVFTGEGIRILRTPPQAPRANSFAERWVRTVRRECLDRILIYGRSHLLATLTNYLRHYNDHRPHQGRTQLPPNAEVPPLPVTDIVAAQVRRQKILNGLINEYSQAA